MSGGQKYDNKGMLCQNPALEPVYFSLESGNDYVTKLISNPRITRLGIYSHLFLRKKTTGSKVRKHYILSIFEQNMSRVDDV